MPCFISHSIFIFYQFTVHRQVNKYKIMPVPVISAEDLLDEFSTFGINLGTEELDKCKYYTLNYKILKIEK